MNLKHGITEERWELSVRRQCILTDALKCLEHPSFAPTKRLSVSLSTYKWCLILKLTEERGGGGGGGGGKKHTFFPS